MATATWFGVIVPLRAPAPPSTDASTTQSLLAGTEPVGAEDPVVSAAALDEPPAVARPHEEGAPRRDQADEDALVARLAEVEQASSGSSRTSVARTW
jgi:hypothetical protein